MTIDRDLPTRDWSWGLLCVSVPVALIGASNLITAEHWWQYATAVAAIAAAGSMAFRGIRDIRLRALGRRTLAELEAEDAAER